MSAHPQRIPPPDPEPPQEAARQELERRQRRVLLVAMLVSVLIHVLLLVVGAWMPRSPEPRTEPADLPITFLDVPPPPEPVTPPDTPVVAEHDRRAEQPPEDPLPPAPPRPQPQPQPRPEVTPQPPQPEPDVAEARPEAADRPLTREEKAQRVRDLLSGMPPSWTRDTPPDSLRIADGLYGTSDLQIESRSDVDWGPWARRVQAKVRSTWYDLMPVAAKVGMEGVVRIHCRVARDGTVHEVELIHGSGNPALDAGALNGLTLSSRLPPLPLPADSDEESIGLTYTFIYNLSDDEFRAWQRQQRIEAARQR